MPDPTHELYCPGCETTPRHGVLRAGPDNRLRLCCPKQACRRILDSRALTPGAPDLTPIKVIPQEVS